MRLYELELIEHPGGTIAAVSGEIDLSSAGELGGRLSAVVAAAPQTLVIDLTGVTFLDSSGLRLLLRLKRELLEYGGKLVVVPGGSRVARLFELTGADQDLELAGERPDLGVA